jgi:hypothetical protein
MGKRMVALQSEIVNAQSNWAWWIAVGNGLKGFSQDYNTMKWKDFKSKYQSIDKNGKPRISNQKNFDGRFRKTYATLELSIDKKDNMRALQLRMVYQNKPLPKQKGKQKQRQKYPMDFIEKNGSNSAYCRIDTNIQQFNKIQLQYFNLDVKYAQQDSASMLFNAFLKYRYYVAGDITLKSMSNRYTIILQTNMFAIPFSSTRQKYQSSDDIWNEIEQKLMNMIIDTNSIKFEGLEISIEGVI